VNISTTALHFLYAPWALFLLFRCWRTAFVGQWFCQWLSGLVSGRFTFFWHFTSPSPTIPLPHLRVPRATLRLLPHSSTPPLQAERYPTDRFVFSLTRDIVAVDLFCKLSTSHVSGRSISSVAYSFSCISPHPLFPPAPTAQSLTDLLNIGNFSFSLMQPSGKLPYPAPWYSGRAFRLCNPSELQSGQGVRSHIFFFTSLSFYFLDLPPPVPCRYTARSPRLVFSGLPSLPVATPSGHRGLLTDFCFVVISFFVVDPLGFVCLERIFFSRSARTLEVNSPERFRVQALAFRSRDPANTVTSLFVSDAFVAPLFLLALGEHWPCARLCYLL